MRSSIINAKEMLKSEGKPVDHRPAILNIIKAFKIYQEEQMILFRDYQRAEQYIKQKTVLRNIIREADRRLEQIQRKIED